MIQRDVGERIDAGLVDEEPIGDAEPLAYRGLQLLSGDRLRHAAPAGAVAPNLVSRLSSGGRLR